MRPEDIKKEYVKLTELIQECIDKLHRSMRNYDAPEGFDIKWVGVSFQWYQYLSSFLFGEGVIMTLRAGINQGEQIKVGGVVVNPLQGLPDHLLIVGMTNDACYCFDLLAETQVIQKYVDPSLQ